MSPAPFNIAPVAAGGPGGGGPGGPAAGGRGAGAGQGGPPPGGCPTPAAPFGGGARGGGAGKEGARGGPGGGPGAPGGGGRGRGAAPDPQVQLERSLLPGLKAAKISFFLASAELDPAIMPTFIDTVKDQLCMAGHCPTVVSFKAHSHMSEVFSPNTPDTSVTGPILKWMKSVK